MKLEEVAAKAEPRAACSDAHPGLSCLTCLADVQSVDTGGVPRSARCLGPAGDPRACNTWPLRQRAGLA